MNKFEIGDIYYFKHFLGTEIVAKIVEKRTNSFISEILWKNDFFEDVFSFENGSRHYDESINFGKNKLIGLLYGTKK